MSNQTLITKRDYTSKKGVTIKAGESVTVRFDVKGRLNGEILPSFVSLNTPDGRRISMRLQSAGIKRPSMQKLEDWSMDSVCKSVFGCEIEPDGWDHYGSPSWLLALGFI
jgi:hypothetical protein